MFWIKKNKKNSQTPIYPSSALYKSGVYGGIHCTVTCFPVVGSEATIWADFIHNNAYLRQVKILTKDSITL